MLIVKLPLGLVNCVNSKLEPSIADMSKELPSGSAPKPSSESRTSTFPPAREGRSKMMSVAVPVLVSGSKPV